MDNIPAGGIAGTGVAVIGAAVVGCGGISATHLAALRALEGEGVRIVSLYDTKPGRVEGRRAEYGGEAAASLEAILDDPRVQTVHILTPHALHAGMVRAALDAGKYVLCEKPLATSTDDLDELARLDPDNRRVCCVFQNRYNPATQRAKAMIDGGELGEIASLKGMLTWKRGAAYYADDWHGTLSLEGGGVLINQAIHTLDLMLYLGGPLRSLKASVTVDLLEGVVEVEENAHIVMRYADNKTGLFFASNSNGADEPPEITIMGERGWLLLRGDRLCLRDGSGERLLVDARVAPTVGKAVYGNSHVTQIHDFYRCVSEGRPFAIGVKEASPAVRAVLAAYGSSRAGSWVSLDK
ncbi:MAG: Gfo/Idh/MocA family oxidoreductase [Oscillospiraceae bacterium]|jgi:predicted dehydrogenase|nr:Gfo/Idh/MocA family oxidoreductase [Oscillospiraceae bacterium]